MDIACWNCPVCGEKLGVDNTPILYGKMGCVDYKACPRPPHATGAYYKSVDTLKSEVGLGISEIALDNGSEK